MQKRLVAKRFATFDTYNVVEVGIDDDRYIIDAGPRAWDPLWNLTIYGKSISGKFDNNFNSDVLYRISAMRWVSRRLSSMDSNADRSLSTFVSRPSNPILHNHTIKTVRNACDEHLTLRQSVANFMRNIR